MVDLIRRSLGILNSLLAAPSFFQVHKKLGSEQRLKLPVTQFLNSRNPKRVDGVCVGGRVGVFEEGLANIRVAKRGRQATGGRMLEAGGRREGGYLPRGEPTQSEH